ncbi:MAG: hypothetical protein IPN13_00025 [Bacteroidetes bacterium]|nr:hypothetical protein [Bacteroidota bacterium]
MRKEAIRHLSELDERIFQISYFKERAMTGDKIYFSNGIVAIKRGQPGWYYPIFSDFKDAQIQSILYWLKMNVEDGKLSDTAIKSIQVLNTDVNNICDFKLVDQCIKNLNDYKTLCLEKVSEE